MQASYKKHRLKFLNPMGTSRGVLRERGVYIVQLKDDHALGLGECAPLSGLSCDDRRDYDEELQQICLDLNTGERLDHMDLSDWPSIRFGFETALLSLRNQNPWLVFESSFTAGNTGIPINGLVVMSGIEQMLAQARKKIAQGFECIKFKIGALDFEAECMLLRNIRSEFPNLEIRLDANGAFSVESALKKIEHLAGLNVHSLEQPIQPKQWLQMAEICRNSAIPIALDEELIGIHASARKAELLETIQPQFIVLKPSLLGGFAASDAWIQAANNTGIRYWITSMLESNIGLNAIAQWVGTKEYSMPQGLGTGLLFERNFPSALQIDNGYLIFDPATNLPSVNSLENLTLQ